MRGGRYAVNIEFEADLPGGKTVGTHVSKLETYLPARASVRLVREDPDGGVVEVEVVLPAETPAMALRDVARAVELVTVGPGGFPTDNPIGNLRSANVTRVGDAP